MPREISLIQSRFNGFFQAGNDMVELRILRSDIDPAWSLEVIYSNGNFRVWNKLYANDEEAYIEFRREIARHDLCKFPEAERDHNIVPFPKLHYRRGPSQN